MPSIARVGDTGDGDCHYDHSSAPGIQEAHYTTTFITGASTVFINGKAACIVDTVGNSTCGHDTIAETGSATVFFEGKAVHRVGDVGENGGPYSVISGSPDVIAG